MLPTLFLLAASHAADVEAPISYADALARAIEANPSLLSARAAVQSAEGSLLSARGTFDPVAGLSVADSRSISEGASQFGPLSAQVSGLEWGASVSQFLATGTRLGLDLTLASERYRYELLETGAVWEPEDPQYQGRLAFRVSQSLLEGLKTAWNLEAVQTRRRALTTAEAEARAALLQAVADAAFAYWNLRYRQDLEEIAEETLAVAEEEARVVAAMVEAGRLAPVEISRVQAVVVQARASRLEAENARRQAADALSVLLGETPGVAWIAMSAPDEPAVGTLDEARVVEAARSGNPGLEAARIAEEGARVALANARHGRLPDLNLEAAAGLTGFETSYEAAIREMASGALRYWSVGVDLTVPMGNRGDRGLVWAAESDLARARVARENAERTLAEQVRAQIRTLEAGREQVEYGTANLDYCRATLSAEKARQQEGRAIQRDVLEAERAVAEAQAGLARARTGYALALVELGRLQGRMTGVPAAP
ncbi:MAG: TolC family protein [Deltaproteobacteria bacterium]|nr:TolC family protein [Deltaproteobacteria bacterium]